MQKVLFAINHSGAEKKLSELISVNPDYKVVGTMVSQDSITDFLKTEEADILVYREGLTGDSDDFKFVIKLRVKYPKLRIVFIAGDREPGDKQIPTLITYAIYDIVAGQRIMVQEMAKLILNPSTLSDVIKWLPGKVLNNGIFSEDELKEIDVEVSQEDKKKIEETVETIKNEPKSIPEEKPKKEKKFFGLSLKDKLLSQQQEKKSPPPIQEKEEDTSIDISESPIEPKAENIEIVAPVIESPIEPQIEPVIPSEEEVEPVLPHVENITKTKEIKIPSRAAADEAEELISVKTKLREAEAKLMDSEKKAQAKDNELEKAWSEYMNLQKQVDSNSKQKVIMFYGAMPGVGTSTLALNVANYLALKRFKVIYVEFNNINPTLSYWYDLSGLDCGMEKALMGIESRAYQEVNKNIVTKQMILDLDSDMKDKHEKYPDLLNYMFFSDSYVKQVDTGKTAPATLKDLLLLLLYKEGYDYVILDMYSHSEYHAIEAASMFSTANVFVMTQDVVTIGNSLRKFASLEASGLDFEMLKESQENKKNSLEPVQNFKNFYVINKFQSDAIFNKKRIVDWLDAEKKIFYVPENTTEIYNAIYKALPVILTSKNKDYVSQIKKIAESI